MPDPKFLWLKIDDDKFENRETGEVATLDELTAIIFYAVKMASEGVEVAEAMTEAMDGRTRN